MIIALAGNPNSGKTTLYNSLTGKNEKIGNWAGVTVEKRIAELKKSYGSEKNTIVDLPGAYSISAYTSEESITSDFIVNSKPDVIINVIDSMNLDRSLYFTTQILELGIPVVIALNKSDIREKKGHVIDVKTLSKELNCPVVEVVATDRKKSSLVDLINAASSVKGHSQKQVFESVTTNKQDFVHNDKERFAFVESLVKKVEIRKNEDVSFDKNDKIDKILAHKWLGLPIFAVVMFLVFYISQTLIGPLIADYIVGLLENFAEYIRGLISGNVSVFLETLLVDGIILGFTAVIGFLPLIMVMFFLLALLEDSGYMARVAVVLDRYFKKVGLSGKSIIPMVIGVGCSIPGVMASRTIKNERERRTTAMLTPFMPCGAKLPVISMIVTAFFPSSSWLTTLTYFVGILLIGLGALLVLRINGIKKPKNYFIIELPEYKVPSIIRSFSSMLDRAVAFIVKAATIILICNVFIQVLQTFDFSLNVVENANESMLATIATPFAFLLVPLGFGVWQLAAASVTGLIAKENIIGTLAVVYSITNLIDTDSLEIMSGAGSEVATVFGITAPAALAFLMFNLYTPPCFAAIGAMNSELQSKKWLFGAILLQLSFAYSIAFIVYQVGTVATTSALGSGFVEGLIIVILIVLAYAFLIKRASKREVLLNA